MKKWEEKKRQQVHQKRVQSAKSTLSKNSNQNYQVTNLKSPVYTNKDVSYEDASPHYTNVSTRPSSSKLSDYYGFEKDNLTQIPLYRLLKYFSLQQYAKALISRGYGYELVKLGTLKKEEREALMNEIKILPGHKVKFGNMVSQITSIYLEVIEQEGSTPPRANYSDRANSIMKPSTSQTTRANHREFDLPKPTHPKPSSANPGMRRLISPKGSMRTEERDFESGHKQSIRKLQSLGLDYFSDSQSSMDDEFAKALNNIISQYEQGMEKPVEAPKQKPKPIVQPQSQTKPKAAEKNMGGGDLMTQVEKMYNKEAKATAPVQTATTTTNKGNVAVKPAIKATSITNVETKTQEKFRPASSQNSTATKPKQEKVKFDLENVNTKSISIPTKKQAMAMDDLGIGNKLEGKSRVLDLLEKKLDSNNLNADNLNFEVKKIKDLYSSFDGATMTSTIANIDIEEMCFCFACAIQKHIDYFVEKVLPTYSPLELKYKPKKEAKPAPEQSLPSTNSLKEDENPSQYNPLNNFDDENQYYIYKGQKVVKEDPDFEISQSKTEAAFDRYTKEDNDEVMISESQVPEEQKNQGLASKRGEEEEEVLYEEEDNVEAGEYNEDNFQDFLRQSLRQSLYVGGGGKQETEEEALMRKYNIDMGDLQPVSANWNVYSDKKNARDEEEPEEDITEEEEDEEEEKLSKSYFSFEESQFVDVEMSALELDMAQRTRLIFEKTYNERNLTQEEINKRIGNKVDNAVISNFCKNVMVTTKMEKEVIVVSLVYVERLMIKTNLYLNSLNWKRICFTAFIIASKIWDDESFENQHFAKVFPQYTIKEINELEKIFLEFIEYDLRVSGSEYAKYYFIMRAFAEKNKKSFSLKALNVQTVRLLQNKADAVAKSLKEQYAEALNRTFA